MRLEEYLRDILANTAEPGRLEVVCPECVRKLTIPGQYAGHQMKCPLCQCIFTAPRSKQRHQEGEKKLADLLRDVYDRTRGQPTKEDAEAARQLCQEYGMATDRAQEIVNRFRDLWVKANPIQG